MPGQSHSRRCGRGDAALRERHPAVGARGCRGNVPGSSPVPPAQLLPLAFEGAAGNAGNGVLVMLSCKEFLSH